MNPRKTMKTAKGNRIQAGIPSGRRTANPDFARGLKIRGVVIATYVAEDPNHPYPNRDGAQQVYCDVLSYSSVSGFRYRIIPKCLVKQERGGAYSGRIWKPKAADIDLSDGNFDLKYSNPANLNGDHVLVGFMDDSFALPVIEGSIGHPSVDPDNEEKDIGNRLNLKLEDGDPDFWKHHGVFHGVDNDGNYHINTTFANDGTLEEDGTEPDPPTDGKGAVYIDLPQDAEWRLQLLDMADPLNPATVAGLRITKDSVEWILDSGDSFSFGGSGADAFLILGDGAVSVAIADHLQTMWNQFITDFAAHTHLDGFGGTGPVNSGPITSYDTNINSTQLTIPDNP